jgi:branched-chain amino acid transport system ATP-binding protein
MSEGPALELAGVHAGYDDTIVLEDNSFRLAAGESVCVIGRNGVGKTTLLATVMGHTRLHAGRILLKGADISDIPIHERALAGLGYVPQEREVFPSLTVTENLEIAIRPGRWTMEAVFEFFPLLAERATHHGNQLSGGEQQMLAIARALIGNPVVLLMDEPTEGLAPVIIDNLVEAMHTLKEDEGLAIILVEQHTEIALDFSPRTMVMDRGRMVFDGASAELKADPDKLGALIGLAGAEVG